MHFSVFATDFNLKKNVFEIDMPPSLYYGGLNNFNCCILGNSARFSTQRKKLIVYG